MNSDKPMQGVLSVRAKVRLNQPSEVQTEFPDGNSFTLERDEALGYALTMLATVRSLYSSAEELNAAVAREQAKIVPLTEPPQALQ